MSQLLTGKRSSAQSGYFRLGLVSLTIPPEEIVTHKIANNDRLTPLRSRFSQYVKTGHSRWDVTISWKALIDYGTDGQENPDFAEFHKLQQILAMFVAAPFVEVENAHLRQLIAQEDSQYLPGDRMAFAMRQMRVDTLADIVDGLQVTLTLSYFNYRPYTTDFDYKGGVSANQSDAFTSYINRWIENNIQQAPARREYPGLLNWDEQVPGASRFSWREYAVITKPEVDPPLRSGAKAASSYPATPVRSSPNAPSLTAPSSNAIPFSTGASTKKVQEPPAYIKQIIINAALDAGIDPNLALAVAQVESHFSPSALNKQTNADGTLLSGATGLFQLVGSAKQWGIQDKTDPAQNAAAGCRYIAGFMQKYNQNATVAMTCYSAGEAYYRAFGLEGTWSYAGPRASGHGAFNGKFISLTWTRQYVDDIGAIYRQRLASAGQTVASQAVAAPTPLPQSTWKPQSNPATASTNPALTDKQIQDLAAQGWFVDHDTNVTFVYRPHAVYLPAADVYEDNLSLDSGLRTTAMSILFVNTLPALPLEGQQYPTYQHIGAAETSVSISLISRGEREEEEEPRHVGLSQLTGALSLLENQYHTFKTQWRSVKSVHRMQAMIVQNQILNMLGIYGVIPEAINTSTVPDSPNLVQVSFACAQYENIFEQLTPFQVKGSGAYAQVWQKDVLDNSALFQKAVAENPILKPLRDLANLMHGGSLLDLFNYLLKYPSLQTVATNTPLTADEQILLRTNLPALRAINGSAAARVNKSSSLNFNDFVLLAYASVAEPAKQVGVISLSGVDTTIKATPTVSDNLRVSRLADLRSNYQKRTQAAVKQGAPDPVQLLWKEIMQSEVDNDRLTASAVQQLELTPDFRKRLLEVGPDAQGPGKNKHNLDHVAYKDLGLIDINDRPGAYFEDHAALFRSRMQESAQVVMNKVALPTFRKFNSLLNATGVDTKSNDSTLLLDANDPSQQTLQSMLGATVYPGGSMDRAFPTYKLFLIEDDNFSVFYMFDDFYSYASVLDIEIIRYQDKPDQAVIQLSNLSNLLSHKIYDGSVEGKYEHDRSFMPEQASASDGSATIGPAGLDTKIQAGRNVGGSAYQDLRAGFDNSGRRMPLQYFALQTGSKIQVRMGFSNNPDELEPVFSGIVTQVEEGPVMTIMAQGFGVELLDASDSPTGWQGFNFTSDGEATSVMKHLLTADAVRHFGHWQVAQIQVEEALKGYGYTQLTGTIAGFLGADRLSIALLASYDRSGENVFIDHSFLPNGRLTQKEYSANFNIEQLASFIPAMYYLPKEQSLAPWTIIQDIKRRYPEFIVAVKQYGFPFGCDATLVYASPNSVYLARLPMIGESENQRITAADNAPFQEWWKLYKEKFRQLEINTLNTTSALGALPRYYQGGKESFLPFLTNLLGPGRSDVSSVQDIDAAGIEAPEVFNRACEYLIQRAQDRQSLSNILSFGLINKSSKEAENQEREVFQLQLNAQRYIQLKRNIDTQQSFKNVPKATDRVKPVRKWILITSNNIIKNSIVLNENFYNSVRVNGHIIACNRGVQIYSQHMRTLDCDRMTIEPSKNLSAFGNMYKRYAVSFLRDELGKMYRGELVLTGIPEIEPYDILMLHDQSTGMVGPVEVESVIHSFNAETGFTSIVKPRCMLAINETITSGMVDGVWQFMKSLVTGKEVSGLLDIAGDAASEHPLATVAGATAGVGLGLSTVAGVQAVAGTAVAKSVIAASGEIVAGLGISLSAPVAITAGALLAAGALCVLASKQQDANPFLLMPLNRFGYPWVAGIDGWEILDLHSSVRRSWENFDTYEIKPYLQLVKDLYDPSALSGNDAAVPWNNRSVTLADNR